MVTNQETQAQFEAIQEKMQAADCPESAIEHFRRSYMRLIQGASGLIPEAEIEALDSASDFEALGDHSGVGAEALAATCILKLNGGLGTSMGLERAKSLLTARGELSFLDIIVKQTIYLREKYSCNLPLVFMNSFRTEADTLAVLEKYPDFAQGQNDIPASFLQNKVPKLCAETLQAIKWDADPSLEWCPPGHGDVYLALENSGILDALEAKGYRHLFISNSDNLGAVMDVSLLGYFVKQGTSLLMEVADRTPADSKGGHVARTKEGQLLLREAAQCPKEELSEFQNTQKYKYFNTNTLWIDIASLRREMKKSAGGIDLPIIKNRKRVNPTDANSPEVFQLETAMGAALGNFADAQVLRIPRSRFAPVKKTDDLLSLRSDAYTMDESYCVSLVQERKGIPPLVSLDPRYYGMVSDFEKRFPDGMPSLRQCDSLRVTGDVVFEKDITLQGEVTVTNSEAEQKCIAQKSVLSGEVRL